MQLHSNNVGELNNATMLVIPIIFYIFTYVTSFTWQLLMFSIRIHTEHNICTN